MYSLYEPRLRYIAPKMLYVLGVVVFIVIVFVSGLCAVRQLYGVPNVQEKANSSIIERFRRATPSKPDKAGDTSCPLVVQAKAFALYLNPPEPPQPKKAFILNLKSTTPPPANPVNLTPKFVLLATCCYRSNPDKSMALVSEPGREERWVKQGARLGRFTIEQIKKGKIVYGNGNLLNEMAVTMKDSAKAAAYTAKARQSPTPKSTPPLKPLNHSKPKEKLPHKPLHKLNPRRLSLAQNADTERR